MAFVSPRWQTSASLPLDAVKEIPHRFASATSTYTHHCRSANCKVATQPDSDTSVMEASTAQAPAKTVLRVAAISGSLRRASANTGLIRAGNPGSLSSYLNEFSLSAVWLLTAEPVYSRGDLQGLHPGVAARPRRHLRAAAAQHRPRGRRRLPSGRRGVPRQGPRGRLLPLRLARVQLLHFRYPTLKSLSTQSTNISFSIPRLQLQALPLQAL